jgi:phospholipase A1/A2
MPYSSEFHRRPFRFKKSGCSRSRVAVFFLTVLIMAFAAPPAHSETDEAKPGLVFEPYKLNYFILNGVPPNDNAQVKFQISAKYQVVGLSDYRLYFAYTQKTFWDIGKTSKPVEESNYNPEIFISHPIDRTIYRNFILKDVTLGLWEHESNGLGGIDSRSWNRAYAASSFGLESRKVFEETQALINYRFLISIKLWIAYSTRNLEEYLESIGRGNEEFSDYSGRGEITASLRDILLPKNQIDFKTRIFRSASRGSYEIGYHQNIPTTDFFIYAQYWYGYGESLSRFAVSDRRFKAGLSFFY